MVAALFACCALYFGLLGTENALSFTATYDILLARSADGVDWNLGPYFWAMHTTFLPTLLYIAIFGLVLIAKYLTVPFIWTLKGAKGNDRPHLAIATTFAFFSGLCTILGTFLFFWFR